MAPMVNDPVAAAAFYGNPGHAKDLWCPQAGATTQESLPRLLFLPSAVAVFALQCPRTPWELHRRVSDLVQAAPEDGPTEDDAALVQKSQLGTTQAEAGKTSPTWTLDITPVVSTEASFSEWCFHHLSATLGQDPIARLPAGDTASAGTPSRLDLSLARMATAV